MNTPQFKIYGIERRKLKKELSQLKSFIKHFWHYHQFEKDMASFYGSSEKYPMSDKDAQNKFDTTILKIESIEKLLSIPYDN